MKRLLFFTLIFLLASALIACETKNEETDEIIIGDLVEDGRESYEGAIMQHISNTNTTLTVYMENATEAAWQSGNMRDYHLEVELDGVWYKVEDKNEVPNTMEAMIFAPGDTVTHTFDFSERYGTLTAGKYRVVKSWWANATETSKGGGFYLTCEFTVD